MLYFRTTLHGCHKEQQCAGSRLDRPGDVFHPDFVHGKPAYFDVTVLQESLLGRSAVSASVAAAKTRMLTMMSLCRLLEVSLSPWWLSPWVCGLLLVILSCRILLFRTTTRSGISRGLVYRHLLEQLSVCLWRHNSRTFLHLFSLLPGSPLWELNSVSCPLPAVWSVVCRAFFLRPLHVRGIAAGLCRLCWS